MELPRQDPDQLLHAIRNDASTKKSGKLKIFFGYAAGVGKTYAMLQAAHQAKERGIDVVAGYIEPHARPQTMALLDGLEQLPVKQVAYEGMILREFDLDAALKRNPQLILVDELAHTNAESSRHTKRYQDVQELLNAGIDVYTTVNVQHIESLNDTVASITGILVRERIPDSTFDQADQVELVDIEPAELLERLASGNVYREDQAQRATVNFFTLENLTALREIALRRCADRVNLLTESARVQSRSDYHTDERILACLSSSPSNAKIIRTAARMARAFGEHLPLFIQRLGAGLTVGPEADVALGLQELNHIVAAALDSFHILSGLVADCELIVVPNQSVQTLQTPEEDTLFLPQQLIHQKWIVRPACWPVFGGQYDLTAKEAVGLVVQGGQRTIAEAEEADIKLALVALNSLSFHVHLTLGGHDGFNIIGLGQGAHIHIIVHHQELVFQVCATESVALHLLDAGGIHAVAQQGTHDKTDAAFALAALADQHEHFLPLGGRQQAVAEKLLQGWNIIFLQ